MPEGMSPLVVSAGAALAVAWALPKSLSSLLIGFLTGALAASGLVLYFFSRLFGPAAPSEEPPPPLDLRCDDASTTAVQNQGSSRGGPAQELAQSRGWLWLCGASQASLKPRSAESQNAAKRFAILSAGRLALHMEPSSEAQVTVDVTDCEVFCAPDPAGGDDRRWWCRLPLLIVNRNRTLLFNDRAVCVFAATAFEKEAWYIALRRATSTHSLVAEAALGGAYASFLRAADMALASAVGGGDPASVPHWLACLNLAAARYFFDLQRNARFATVAAGRIQEQLDRLDLPPGVAPLKVTRLQLPAGGAPPRAHHLVLCGPEAHPALSDITLSRGPIPVFQAEVTYTGGLVVDIETRIDVAALALQIGWDLTGGGSGNHNNGDSAAGEGEAQTTAGDTAAPRESSSGHAGRGDMSLPQRLLATHAGAKLQETASRWGQKLSSTPLRLSLSLQELSGTLRLWFAPPPGDRLWFCFTSPPVFRMRAVPAFGDRAIAHPKLAAWVSDRIVDHLRGELATACVLPNTGDVPLSGLIHPQVPEMDIATARALNQMPSSAVPATAAKASAAHSADTQTHPLVSEEPERTMEVLAAALAATQPTDEMERIVSGEQPRVDAPLSPQRSAVHDAMSQLPSVSSSPLQLSAPYEEATEPMVWPPPEEAQAPRPPPPAWLQISPPDSPRGDNPFAPVRADAVTQPAAVTSEPPSPATTAIDEAGSLDHDAMLALLKTPPPPVDSPQMTISQDADSAVLVSPPRPQSKPVSVPESVTSEGGTALAAATSPRPKDSGHPKWMENLKGAAVRAVVEAAPKVQRALAQTEEKLRQAHAQAVAAQHAAAQRRLAEKKERAQGDE